MQMTTRLFILLPFPCAVALIVGLVEKMLGLKLSQP
jgi:hypothetical protein